MSRIDRTHRYVCLISCLCVWFAVLPVDASGVRLNANTNNNNSNVDLSNIHIDFLFDFISIAKFLSSNPDIRVCCSIAYDQHYAAFLRRFVSQQQLPNQRFSFPPQQRITIPTLFHIIRFLLQAIDFAYNSVFVLYGRHRPICSAFIGLWNSLYLPEIDTLILFRQANIQFNSITNKDNKSRHSSFWERETGDIVKSALTAAATSFVRQIFSVELTNEWAIK